jgi:regulator of protease activity HflC (stomatin/prohibitin superfamily)
LSGVFIFAIVLAIIALICAFTLPSYTERSGKVWKFNRIFGVTIGAFALLVFVLSCFTVVGTQNVGIPTSFGKPTGDTYSAGLHTKAPWVKVTDIDATVQPEEYKGSCKTGESGNGIKVKIADGGDACVWAAYRWRINKDQADTAFTDYRKAEGGVLEGIRKALVSTNVKAALNEVFGKFDPLSGADIKPNMTPEELANLKINVVPDTKQLSANVKASIEEKISGLGGLIDIESVTISFVELPESTQKRINAFNAAVQDTKIATQEIATKAAQARANEKLAASLQNPAVLISKCLDGLISGDITNVPGFTCFGEGSSIVLPATK